MVCRYFFLVFSIPLSLFSMLTGNPAAPHLETSGIISTGNEVCSFRAGYLDDWVYNEKIKGDSPKSPATLETLMRLSTYAGLFTLNIKNRVDLYTLLGSSRMQLDHEMFTKRAFAWGLGTKVILLKEGDFYFGFDFKYFETNQKPKYLVYQEQAFNFLGDFRLNYYEVQAAVGASYKAWLFAPYINATYLTSKLNPTPLRALFRFPLKSDGIEDTELAASSEKNKWGMALGLTLIDEKKVTISVEWRSLNQNAVDVNGEIRF